VAALGLNAAPDFQVILALPLRNDDEVAGDLLKVRKNTGKALSGRFFEREDLNKITI